MTSRMTPLYAKRRAERLCLRCTRPLEEGRKAATCAKCNHVTGMLAKARKAARDALDAADVAHAPACRVKVDSSVFRSCPICGWRDITTETDYGDQILPCCSVCCSDEPAAGYPIDISISARAVLLARTCPGLTAPEIADEMGVEEGDRSGVWGALHGAVKAGVLRVDDRRHYPTARRWVVTDANTKKRSYARRAA